MDQPQTPEDVRRFVCTVDGCGKRFKRKFTLQEHEKTHSGIRPYACPVPGCNRHFSTSGNLSRHTFTHTGEKPYACAWESCDKRFCTREKLVRHLKTHVGLRPYTCQTCKKAFTTSGNLARHAKSHLPASERPNTVTRTTKSLKKRRVADELATPMACQAPLGISLMHLEESDQSNAVDESDIDAMWLGQDLERLCLPSSGSSSMVNSPAINSPEHVTWSYPPQQEGWAQQGVYGVCMSGNGMEFILLHLSDEPPSDDDLPVCGRCTLLMNNEERRYACTICDKIFKRKFTLKEHIKTHSGLRPYVCPEIGCGRRYTTSGNLVRHSHTHLQDKAFVCHWENCKKRFCSREKLGRHLRVHCGSREHKCHECGKIFTTSSNLNRHCKAQGHDMDNDVLDISFLFIGEDSTKKKVRIAEEVAAPRDCEPPLGLQTQFICNPEDKISSFCGLDPEYQVLLPFMNSFDNQSCFFSQAI